MYRIDSKVTTSTCDNMGKLKLFSAFQMMQDCSELWVQSESKLSSYFRDANHTQLLAFRQVEVERVPDFGEDLHTETSVYEVKPMFGFRNTFIYDSSNKPCYRTWSMGAFVDRSNGALIRMPQEVMDSIYIEEKKPMNYLPRRIMVPRVELKPYTPFTVGKNDIDYNGHMNNANYIRMAEELRPDDFQVGVVRIEFRMPAKLHDEITPFVFQDGPKLYVQLMLGNNVSTLIEYTSR